MISSKFSQLIFLKPSQNFLNTFWDLHKNGCRPLSCRSGKHYNNKMASSISTETNTSISPGFGQTQHYSFIVGRSADCYFWWTGLNITGGGRLYRRKFQEVLPQGQRPFIGFHHDCPDAPQRRRTSSFKLLPGRQRDVCKDRVQYISHHVLTNSRSRQKQGYRDGVPIRRKIQPSNHQDSEDSAISRI